MNSKTGSADAGLDKIDAPEGKAVDPVPVTSRSAMKTIVPSGPISGGEPASCP